MKKILTTFQTVTGALETEHPLLYNTFISKGEMHYLCLLDGIIEYAANDWNQFQNYQAIYAEEHQDAEVQYLTLTDEEYDQFFAPLDEEE